jgi:hypothetical protein
MRSWASADVHRRDFDRIGVDGILERVLKRRRVSCLYIRFGDIDVPGSCVFTSPLAPREAGGNDKPRFSLR